MTPSILILDRAYIGHDLDYSALAELGQLTIRDFTLQEDLADLLVETAPDVVVANRPLFGAGLLESLALDTRPAIDPRWPSHLRDAPRPGLICLCATGTNTVDLPAARAAGIAVCNVVGYSTDSVAQQTFSLVLQLLNQTSRFDRLARTWHQRCSVTTAGHTTPAWTPLDLPIHELSGRTWGIIGLGTIGRRVAEIAQAFGCRVIWTSVSGQPRAEAWPAFSLDDLLAQSDIVSIHSPVNEQTKGIVGMAQLMAMKKDALLINVGRGGIVVEDALATVLGNGHLGGAALDVLWPEPPEAANPLFSLPAERLILTPHIAWAAVEARQRLLTEVALNIASWLQGHRRNRVD